jgi:hypothetical protein
MESATDLLLNHPQDPFETQPSKKGLHYAVIAQAVEDLQDLQNSPAVSMGPYLISSGQTRILTTLSVYGMRGESRAEVRLLYMNSVALRIWNEMGMNPGLLGWLHRPPHSALLSFGVPFSE